MGSELRWGRALRLDGGLQMDWRARRTERKQPKETRTGATTTTDSREREGGRGGELGTVVGRTRSKERLGTCQATGQPQTEPLPTATTLPFLSSCPCHRDASIRPRFHRQPPVLSAISHPQDRALTRRHSFVHFQNRQCTAVHLTSLVVPCLIQR